MLSALARTLRLPMQPPAPVRLMAKRAAQAPKPRDSAKVANLFKRGARGLFGGKMIQFGNIISFSNKKSRRTWKPNVQSKRFWSETYNRFLHFRAAIQMSKNLRRIHASRAENLEPAETNAQGVLSYRPLDAVRECGPVGGPQGLCT
ncbi:50S ribosomal protein L24 [Emiliania huxleyi CCMP1516]|uniref:50S ribosomal protein L24 n=2 Tax=Emiliania huxleyi TaxID=2903 RepID=A0A0D3KGF1_EMIH1|nr:50S ribosomal protein L24 [Emiliania huxleyi CCMP1516]EOD34836.1 50S ribosomal protein L24 [Emiliania huxleyi CCMP1516]|eukprot:XP_005787265.1 50S ribosomal protein L24 [Emiliania huxleyi CCMP1516]